jgi:preprotein translocase subunit SecD
MKKLAFLIIILSLLGCAGPEEKSEKVAVEFRLAEIEPDEGLTEMTISGSEEKFYLHDEVLLTNADIAFALASSWENRPVVELTLTQPGGDKFARITRDNIGRRIGILVDGKLINVPIIRAPIEQGKAIIDGNFSEEEANRIASGIMLK